MRAQNAFALIVLVTTFSAALHAQTALNSSQQLRLGSGDEINRERRLAGLSPIEWQGQQAKGSCVLNYVIFTAAGAAIGATSVVIPATLLAIGGHHKAPSVLLSVGAGLGAILGFRHAGRSPECGAVPSADDRHGARGLTNAAPDKGAADGARLRPPSYMSSLDEIHDEGFPPAGTGRWRGTRMQRF
jgi:hypothetical protein